MNITSKAVKVSNLPTYLTGSALVVFLAVAHLASDTVTGTFSALLPTLQQRFGLTETTLALLVATLAFSASVTQPLFSALADRIGRRQVAALGILLNAGLLSLIGLVPTLYLLFGLLLAGGLGSAALHPALASLVRTAGGRKAKLSVSLYSAGGTVGMALGPVIILVLVSSLGLSFTPWLMVPGILVGFMMYFVVPAQESVPLTRRPKVLDPRLLLGPVGLLSITGILSNIAVVTFTSAVPLWLVQAYNLAPDSALIGWTLAAFSLSAALGGIIAGALSRHLNSRLIITGSLLLALLPLTAIFFLEPGTGLFFLAVMLAGALLNASLPLMIVIAQDLVPQSAATASGMLMGFTGGVAGVLYIGTGRLQEIIGLAPAMGLSYLALLPAALLVFYVLTKYGPATEETWPAPAAVSSCSCFPGLGISLNTAQRTEGQEIQSNRNFELASCA